MSQETDTTQNPQFSRLLPVELLQNRNIQPVKPFENKEIGDQATEETYEKTAISSFGSKFLGLKSGWKAGQPIGRTNAKIIEPIEYLPRQHNLGLGAKALTAKQAKNLDKDNYKAQRVTEDYENEEGGAKNYKSIHAELKVKQKMQKGSQVRVVQGKHEGLEGRVLAMEEDSSLKKFMGDDVEEKETSQQYVSIELKESGLVVAVKKKYLELLKKESHKEKKRERSRSREERQKSQKKLKWIIPGIYVRYVSKKREELYGHKFKIVDVLDKYEFIAEPATGQFEQKRFEDLREDDLETIIPSQGKQVYIVYGKWKGEKGKLLMRDKKKDKCSVQVLLDVVEGLSQDDISAAEL